MARPLTARTSLLWLIALALSVGSASAQANHESGPLPSYEVATIKPWDGKGFGLPLRAYILDAFGMQPSATAQLIGPSWINETRYVIVGKASDTTQNAMKEMTPAERVEQIHLMEQSLLADRFALKAHTETRVLPAYQFVLAKGGSKLKENADSLNERMRIGRKGQMSEIKGTAVTIHNLISVLLSDPEIGGRTVVDHTGLTGAYDFQLDWMPLGVAGSANGVETLQDTEGPSLFTAIEEQLGLRLVSTKVPVKVIVIDHIEPPTKD